MSDPTVTPAPPPPSFGTDARRTATLIVALVLAVGLAVLLMFLPVPYVELSPGASCDTLAQTPSSECAAAGIRGPVVTIDGNVKTYPTSDKLFFTTVGVGGAPGESKLTLLQALRGWFSSSTAVVPKALLFPPSSSGAQVNCENTREQQESQNNATTAALRALKYTVPTETRVYVNGFTPNSPAQAAGLDVCDDIVSVNGTAVSSTKQLTTLIGEHAVGDVVHVGYLRDGTPHTADVRLTASTQGPRRPLIGVEPKSIGISKPPFTVHIDAGSVGGPSAGLMYALAIVDKLTPGDLTGGTVVAGTGEITPTGEVGEIGGIQQKLITAHDHGATVFLVPHGNCAEARHGPPKGLRLVDVSTLTNALSALAAVRHEPGGVIHDCTS